MTRLISRVVLAVAMVCLTSVASMAQTTATSTETKTFEIVAVDGNLLVVRMPEGTREVNVPPDFRFMVNGQPLAVGQLKAGMKGTATITTKTTYTPVTVTEVKNGTVMQGTGTEHHRQDRRGNQDVLAAGTRQARGQTDAGWQTCTTEPVPSGRSAVGDHHHVNAATGHDRKRSAGDHIDRSRCCKGTCESCVGLVAGRVEEHVGIWFWFVIGGTPGTERDGHDSAEDRDVMAALRTRQCVVARARARADYRAPPIVWRGPLMR